MPKTQMRSEVIVTKLSKEAVIAQAKFAICRMHRVSNCGNAPGSRRDICDSCYQSVAIDVANGVIKWVEVEELGLCSPRKRDFMNRLRSAVTILREQKKTAA